jgi:hypothetical protein
MFMPLRSNRKSSPRGTPAADAQVIAKKTTGAPLAEPRAVLGAASGDRGLDASGPEQPAVRVVVVAAIAEDHVALLARTADPARDGPRVQVPEQRNELGYVVAVTARERDTASGIPVASTRRWCFEPVRERSTGEGPVRSPQRTRAHGSHRPPRATSRSRRPR